MHVNALCWQVLVIKWYVKRQDFLSSAAQICFQPGIAAGDVIFMLIASQHKSFERNGNDLLTHVTITLSEALLGFSRVILTHLDGRGIKFSSPKRKIIKPGDAIVIREEGMPVHKRPHEKGNLYVIFDVEMPTADWLRTVDARVGD